MYVIGSIMIEEVRVDSVCSREVYRSEQIDQIMGALSKAQGSYKPLKPNQEASGKKFANLEAILDAVRESLSENGLGFFQFIELLDEGSGATLLKTTIGHSSGQYIASCARVVPGKTDKRAGNRYEIYKRIHALMLLGIAPSDNDPVAFDDDGDVIEDEHLVATVRKGTSSVKPEIDHDNVINSHQYDELLLELEGYPELAKEIMKTYDIGTLADLPKEQYHIARRKIRDIKKTFDEYVRKK